MDLMMSGKEVCLPITCILNSQLTYQAAWAQERAAGNYESKKWNGFAKKRSNKNKIECKDGRVEAVVGDADQTYKCKNIVRFLFMLCKTLC